MASRTRIGNNTQQRRAGMGISTGRRGKGAMNTNLETIAGIRGAGLRERREEVDLHPARGILLAVFVSALIWTAVVAAILAA